MNSAVPTEYPRTAATTGGLTPRRTIAIAVLMLVAAIATPSAVDVINGLLVERCLCPGAGGHSSFAHALGHLLGAVLLLAIALGISRLRRAWPAKGSTERDTTPRLEKQYRLMAFAQRLALVAAAGQLLAGAGANFIDVRSLEAPPHEGYFTIVHAAGEVFSLVSWMSLILVCLHMLGVGVRGALRRTAQPS
jgi:hypothetical protein